jgi:bacterioferritin
MRWRASSSSERRGPSRKGVPDLSDYNPILVGRTVREQIDNDLTLEMGALAVLRSSIQLCVEAGDYATRGLLECILKDEEHRVDGLEAQKHKINEVGYDGYLAQQIYHRD